MISCSFKSSGRRGAFSICKEVLMKHPKKCKKNAKKFLFAKPKQARRTERTSSHRVRFDFARRNPVLGRNATNSTRTFLECSRVTVRNRNMRGTLREHALQNSYVTTSLQKLRFILSSAQNPDFFCIHP